MDKLNQTNTRDLSFIDDYSDTRVHFAKRKSAHSGQTLEITCSSTELTGVHEKQRCDMGHDHVVPQKKQWVWERIYLDQADIKNLREFLNDPRWNR